MKRMTWIVNGEARIMLNGVEICGTITHPWCHSCGARMNKEDEHEVS